VTAARKLVKEWMPGELERELVMPAVSTDETREYLNKPWGQVMNGRGFVCGTDGHRLHAVACEAWDTFKRGNAPPAEQVIPWDEAKRVGELELGRLDDARVFPAKWNVKLDVQPHVVLAHVSVKRGKSKGDAYPFGRDGVRVDWLKLDALTFGFGMHLDYLLEAVDFVGTGLVQVWGSEPLAPFAFTSTKVTTLREADRIAIVMPMRI
jgi:hypothetical protein